MADQPEVIQENLEQTRQALAEKLETLERKVAGTVENVTESIQETVESVTDTVQKTVETVSGTVEAVTGTVQDTVESVKEGVASAFDLYGHVQRHPWLTVGGAVLVGFLGGRLLGAAFAASGATPAPPEPADAGRGATRHVRNGRRHAHEKRMGYTASEAATDGHEGGTQPQQAVPGWISKFTSRFGSELEALKGLAVGTTLGVMRDMIVNGLPQSLKRDVTDLMNNLTENLGGKTIHGPVFEEESQESTAPSGGPMSRAG